MNKQKQLLKKVLCKNAEANVRRCSVKKDVLKNFTKLRGNHLISFLIKLQTESCRIVNVAETLRTPFLQSTSRQVLLLKTYILQKTEAATGGVLWKRCS